MGKSPYIPGAPTLIELYARYLYITTILSQLFIRGSGLFRVLIILASAVLWTRVGINFRYRIMDLQFIVAHDNQWPTNRLDQSGSLLLNKGRQRSGERLKP